MSEILSSLQKVNEELLYIGKDQKVSLREGGRQYLFRGIDQVLNALSPLFKKHGVLVSRRNLETQRLVRQVQSKYGPRDYIETFINRCDYVFTSTKDGSEFVSQGFGEGQDSSGTDKSASMATSNAYKYVIFEMFSIATEEQKDSDQRTEEMAEREKQETKNKTAPPKPGSTPPAPSQKEKSPPAKETTESGKSVKDKIVLRIRAITDNFKQEGKVKNIYKGMGIENGEAIKKEKDPRVLAQWLTYVEGRK